MHTKEWNNGMQMKKRATWSFFCPDANDNYSKLQSETSSRGQIKHSRDKARFQTLFLCPFSLHWLQLIFAKLTPLTTTISKKNFLLFSCLLTTPVSSPLTSLSQIEWTYLNHESFQWNHHWHRFLWKTRILRRWKPPK